MSLEMVAGNIVTQVGRHHDWTNAQWLLRNSGHDAMSARDYLLRRAKKCLGNSLSGSMLGKTITEVVFSTDFMDLNLVASHLVLVPELADDGDACPSLLPVPTLDVLLAQTCTST